MDGFDAGVKIAEFKPDLVILDLVMPNMDGFEACRRIKTNPNLKTTKVLILTGYDTKENRYRMCSYKRLSLSHKGGGEISRPPPLHTDRKDRQLGKQDEVLD